MTNAIAQIFDKPSGLLRGLQDVSAGIDPLGSAVFKFGADTVHDVAKNPIASTLVTGAAGFFGGPWGAAGASAALSRERGEDLGTNLRAGAIAGGLTYAAGQLGGSDGGTTGGGEGYDGANGVNYGSAEGYDGVNGVNYDAPSASGSVEPAGANYEGTESGMASEPTTAAKATETPVEPKSPTEPVPPKAAGEPTLLSKIGTQAKKTAVQVGTTAAITSLLMPKKPDQPTPTVRPVTPMPDPLAQEQARRRALVEQIMRRGRTSTIMTDRVGA